MNTEFTPDQKAAHQFLTELRTRISTQPLPYQHGVEARALESLWEVFGQARDAIKDNPGCERFADRTTEVLNCTIRPLTAKWHRAFVEGRLNGRDGADEFRGELQRVQEELRKFAEELHAMAYGQAKSDTLTPDVMSDAELDRLFQPLAFGVTASASLHAETAQQISSDEGVPVQARRKHHGLDDETRRKDAQKAGAAAPEPNDGHNAIGLSLSGGGIRSATFSLGVVQVLAERGFLKEVDFLSTVSGGGYTGSFLTQRLGNGEPLSDVAKPHGPDPEPIRYVRLHAQFLSGNLKEKWAMVTATLAGMFLNWTVPLLVILVLALLADLLGKQGEVRWPLLVSVGGVLVAVAMVVYGIGMRLGRTPSLVTGRILGVLLALTGMAGVGWLLEATVPGLMESLRKNWGTTGGIGAALAALVGAAPGIVRFLPVLKAPNVRKTGLKIALWLAGLLVPLIALLLFYAFRGIAAHHPTLLWVIVGVLAVVSLLVININLTGPHRLYRDRLARTFIQKAETGTPDVKLTEMNPRDTAPYHLVNTALNVPSSGNPAIKDRGCDFFLFSKKWTGSSAVGYRPTGEWKANGQDVDLATAMAVSGAAVSTHMGLGNMPTLTALLTLVNVRLGFWIKKPTAGGWPSAPGFLCLLREMTGIAMSEKASWLNLSDGGHIENLALYELLRRRCKFIICVDGEADPTFTFKGLMTLVRHAQIDFGIRIEPRLDDLRPDPKTGYSKCHFHLCRIQYPEGIGLLLYVKLSVTGNESELIRRYRTNNPDFPHQSTLDQFFDQEQFEAYRQLGIHAAEGLFLRALMDGTTPGSVREWFRQLAKNLLEPIPSN